MGSSPAAATNAGEPAATPCAHPCRPLPLAAPAGRRTSLVIALLVGGQLLAISRVSCPPRAFGDALPRPACAPAGEALSVDRWLASRRSQAPPPRASELARWPVLVARWTLALTFLSAAMSKLGRAGLERANGSTLQYVAFVKGAQLDTPLGVRLSRQYELCVALSWVVLVLEGSLLLVLVRPRLARLYVPLAAAMVVAIHLTVGAAFYQLLVPCAAFVPWSTRVLDRAPPRREPAQVPGSPGAGGGEACTGTGPSCSTGASPARAPRRASSTPSSRASRRACG